MYRLRHVEKTRTKGGGSFTLLVPYLDIRRGQFVSVVGPSGCGKSTLLDLLALVLCPTRCETFDVCIDDHGRVLTSDISQISDNQAAAIRRRNIGYVLQSGGLLPFLTVRENIMLTAQLSAAQVAAHDFISLIDTLRLDDQVNKKPQHLSGGQRQRAAIARAIIHRPAIILADEPTAAVDFPTALEIRDELRSLAKRLGAAVVMVTHDRNLVEGIADQEVQFQVERRSASQIIATVSASVSSGTGTKLTASHAREEQPA